MILAPMSKQITKLGFSIIELIAVIIVLIILASILLPTVFGGKNQANDIRCKDEAAALNSAESTFNTYITTTAVSMGTVNNYTNISTDPATRINNLLAWGFLTSKINTNDVSLSLTNSSTPLWLPMIAQ